MKNKKLQRVQEAEFSEALHKAWGCPFSIAETWDWFLEKIGGLYSANNSFVCLDI